MADLLSTTKGFLSKHSSELRVITGLIGSIVSALPLQAQEKERATAALDALDEAADRIAAAVGKIKPDQKVTVKKSDIVAAVKAELPGILRDLVKEEIANQAAK